MPHSRTIQWGDGRGAMSAVGEYGGVESVEAQLVAEYGDRWSTAYLADVINQARADLAGQIIPSALPEMLDRLVRHRLAELDGTNSAAS